jgi:hypothetical protein
MRLRGRGAAVVVVVVVVVVVAVAAAVLVAAGGRPGVRRAVVSVSAGGGTGRSAAAADGAAGRVGPGQRAGAGFQPVAASFPSPTRGFVFGSEGCRFVASGLSCPGTLAVTGDGGARWRFRPAPAAGHDQADQVVFASSRTGWVYGPQLWVTRDGGWRWRRLLAGLRVETMVVAGPRVYAVVKGQRAPSPARLLTSPVSRDAWAPVRAVTDRWFAVLAASGRTVWFAALPGDVAGGTAVVWTNRGGSTWHSRRFTCPGRFYTLSAIAAASPSDVAFLCASTAPYGMTQEGIELLTSADGGARMRLAGRWVPAVAGGGGMLAIPPHRPGIISFAPPVDATGWLGRSADGGRTWRPQASSEIGVWNSLSYVSPDTGWIVNASGPDSQLLRTTNAGRTWHPITFPAISQPPGRRPSRPRPRPRQP